jgi:geranylgeranylglycerol-phosphate geranylgeranyltransferase
VPLIAALSTRVIALLELMRLDKTVAAAVFMLLGAYIAASPGELWSARTFTASAVVGLITAFGLVINDYCDVAEDSIGKPQRPIPSGRVSRRLAGTFAWALAAIALVTSALLGARALLFATAMVGISAAYSFRLKDTVILGNAAVALLVSCTLVYGAFTIGRVTASVWIAVIITFPYMLAQEALFNLEDEECDRVAGLRTTATYLGIDGAATFVRTVLAGTMAIALAPWFLGSASLIYLGALTVCILAPITLMIFLLRQPLSWPAVGNAVKLSRLVWVTSLLPLALLK